MISPFYFISADSFLGKVDKHSLSQQTLMELLIEGISNKEKICGYSEPLNDVTYWEKVILNLGNEVITIEWPQKSLEGSIELQWLPLSTKRVNLFANWLTGSVDLTCLPDGLETLFLGSNRFDGTIDLTRLPPGMRNLGLQRNGFYGKTDFSQLPKSLRKLEVSYTQLEGEIVVFDGRVWTDDSNVNDRRK